MAEEKTVSDPVNPSNKCVTIVITLKIKSHQRSDHRRINEGFSNHNGDIHQSITTDNIKDHRRIQSHRAVPEWRNGECRTTKESLWLLRHTLEPWPQIPKTKGFFDNPLRFFAPDRS